jgi:hypothetical protein
MFAGAVIALAAAGFTAWRGPRHATPELVELREERPAPVEPIDREPQLVG